MKIKLFAGCATSVSRSAPKRKKRNPRSAFLSKFMSKMSGGAGDAVIHAFAQQDANAFKAAFTNVMNANPLLSPSLSLSEHSKATIQSKKYLKK